MLSFDEIRNIIQQKSFNRKTYFFNKRIIHMNERSALCSYRLKSDPNQKILIKKSSSKQILNSYDISFHILNNLPHFRSTYGYRLSLFKNYHKLYLEYIQGITFDIYLKKYFSIKIFHNLLFQIIFTLEESQEKHKFTHYDLHFKNILVCRSDSTKLFQFTINGHDVLLDNLGWKIIIIDFDFSCSRSLKHIYVEKKLMSYGYLGIFLAGHDLLRFFFCLRKIIRLPNIDKYLKFFVNYFFFNFFKIINMDEKCTDIHEKYFFCMIHKTQIYLTPLQYYIFLKENYKIFNINNIPNIKNLSICKKYSNIYIPVLTSSEESIKLFIEKFQDIKAHTIEDIYIHRIVYSLKKLLLILRKENIKSISIPKAIINLRL